MWFKKKKPWVAGHPYVCVHMIVRVYEQVARAASSPGLYPASSFLHQLTPRAAACLPHPFYLCCLFLRSKSSMFTSQDPAHSLFFLPVPVYPSPDLPPLSLPTPCPCCLSPRLQLDRAEGRGSSTGISSSSAALIVDYDSGLALFSTFSPPTALHPLLPRVCLCLWGVRLRDLICLAFTMNPTVKIHLQNGTHFNTYMYQVGTACAYWRWRTVSSSHCSLCDHHMPLLISVLTAHS